MEIAMVTDMEVTTIKVKIIIIEDNKIEVNNQ